MALAVSSRAVGADGCDTHVACDDAGWHVRGYCRSPERDSDLSCVRTALVRTECWAYVIKAGGLIPEKTGHADCDDSVGSMPGWMARAMFMFSGMDWGSLIQRAGQFCIAGVTRHYSVCRALSWKVALKGWLVGAAHPPVGVKRVNA